MGNSKLPRPMRRLPSPGACSAALLALVLGCAGARREETVRPAPPPAADAAVAPAPAPSSEVPEAWRAYTTPEALATVVTTQARARLAELAPAFQWEQLAAYASNPASAPELSGRAVERLLDLATVELALGRPEAAVQAITVVRARARNRNSAYVGNLLLTEARRRLAGADAAAQRAALERTFGELPTTRFNAATVFYQLMQRPEQLRARVGNVQRSLVTMETAQAVLLYGTVAPQIVAARDTYLAAIEAVRTANNARPAQTPYAFGTVDLTGARDAQPVAIGVWDLGTNLDLFPNQQFTNAAELANGRDDDGNGQVDDIHGVVADGDAPNTALVFDPGAETITQYGPQLRGVMDLRTGLSSTPAAQRVLALMRAVTNVEEQRALDRNLDAIGEWAHGTHVAGIMLQGIPQARLAVFRSAWAGERRLYRDRGPTDAELEAENRNMQAIGEFVRRHHLRVVNASLGFSLEYLEDQLRHQTDLYTSDEQVRARARAIHDRRRGFWQALFAACPETLFVVAAGNSNEDVVEYEELAASLQAPNLVAVGAVDRFGQWATFTNSNPERVRVFDHGVEVDSLIPSGEHVPLSGTSMASPNVANLAAKLFSLDPALTPARVIALLYDTGDPIAAPFNGHIANETRAVERVRAERRPAGRTTPRRH